MMPGMDGFQVMEELKGIEQDGYLPVLVTAGATASIVGVWGFFFLSYHGQYAFH